MRLKSNTKIANKDMRWKPGRRGSG